MGKTKFQIDLGLSDIKIKSINRDNFGGYHIYVSCTAKQAICHNCGKTINDLKLAFTIYEISEKALYKLSDQGIAVEVINSLKSLKGMRIQGRDQFLD